jgi:hypothetical protein
MIQGFNKDEIVLQGRVILSSDSWSFIMPSARVPLDTLVIPAMVDFDSMILSFPKPEGKKDKHSTKEAVLIQTMPPSMLKR